jgi:hypothetical protein
MSDNNNHTTDSDKIQHDPMPNNKSMDAQKILALVSSVAILVTFVVFWSLQITDVATLLREVYG